MTERADSLAQSSNSFLASNLQKIIDLKEINSASERQFNNVIAAVEKVLEDHRLQIEDLYSSVRICPSGSLRFGPQVTLGQMKII